MVQNAGLFLKIEHSERRERLEIVPIYLLYGLCLRQFGIRICLEKFQLPALFNAHWQCLGLILEETVCCQCRTEIHKEVMYRAMA